MSIINFLLYLMLILTPLSKHFVRPSQILACDILLASYVSMGLRYKANEFVLLLHELINLVVLYVAGARKRLGVKSIMFLARMPFGM